MAETFKDKELVSLTKEELCNKIITNLLDKTNFIYQFYKNDFMSFMNLGKTVQYITLNIE